MADFSLLQAIPQAKVVGTLPSVQPQGGVAGASNGALSGALQGSQLANDFQNRANVQQQMDQRAELQPFKLQEAQGLAQTATAQGEAATMTMDGIKALRDNAQQGLAAALEEQRKVDPIGAMKTEQQYAETRNAQGIAAKSLAEGGTAQLEYIDRIRMSAANEVNKSVAYATDPQTKQIDWNKADAIYQQSIAPIIKSAPDMRDSYPQKLDASSYALATTDGIISSTNYAEKQIQKSGTESQKDTQREINLSNKEKIGSITANEQLELSRIRERQGSRARGQTNNPLTSELAKQDAKAAGDASTLRGNMETMHVDAQDVLKQLPNVPEVAVGPIQKGMGLDKLSPEAQKIVGPLNAMALQLKEYYKLGSGQGFTDADRDFLTEIAGNTGFYKYPLQTIVERMDKIAGSARYNAWKKENGIRKRDSAENYQSWLESNPEPAKEWEPNKSESPIVPNNTQTLNGVTYIQKDGKWYTK